MTNPVRPKRIYRSRAERIMVLQDALNTAKGCGMGFEDGKQLVGSIWKDLRQHNLPNNMISIGALRAMVRREAKAKLRYG